MKLLNKYSILVFLSLHFLLIIFIRSALYPIHYVQQNSFLNFELLVLLDLGNLILLWLISKRLFRNLSFIPPLIYSVIPWSSYLVSAGSFYIYLLFLILLTFYIYISLKSKKILVFLLIIPLLLGFINILSGEVKIFSDPGLLNMVNEFQGAARQDGFGNFAKISENKYLIFSEYVLLKYLKQLVPTSYFTSQEKLLNFSFSSPIYFGFLIPFLYGLYKILINSYLRKTLFVSSLLIIPSILSKQIVDLNRLILFSPIIIFVISYGILKIFEQKKQAKILILLIFTLVVFQFLITLSDIHMREKDRYIKYFGQNYELGRQ